MASEKIRFYNRDTLAILAKIPDAKGVKLIKPTLAHAKKYGFLPSVTSVLNELHSGGISDYEKDNVIEACIANPWESWTGANGRQFEPRGSRVAYKRFILEKSREKTIGYADLGSAIHLSVQNFIEHDELPHVEQHKRICTTIWAWLKKKNLQKISCERPIGGKKVGDKLFVGDLKTTNLARFKSPYDKWKLQLGGYGNAMKSDYVGYAGTADISALSEVNELWQFVADRNSGEVIFIPLADPEQWEGAFVNLFELWCVLKQYDPRKWEKKA